MNIDLLLLLLFHSFMILFSENIFKSLHYCFLSSHLLLLSSGVLTEQISIQFCLFHFSSILEINNKNENNLLFCKQKQKIQMKNKK